MAGVPRDVPGLGKPHQGVHGIADCGAGPDVAATQVDAIGRMRPDAAEDQAS
jgi:hypothetical protein